MADKIKEGDAKMSEGDSKLKTSWSRWKPDWDSALMCYDRAAICYKNGRANDKAVEAYKKLSAAHLQLDGLNSAAKALENAAALEGDVDASVQLLREAASHYRDAGSPDRAAEALVKGAKTLERSAPEKGVSLLLAACEIYEAEERFHFARETFATTLQYCVRHRQYPTAVAVLRRHCKIFRALDQMQNVWKANLSILVLHLANEDFASADTAFEEFVQEGAFTNSEEWFSASDLLDAFAKADEDKLAETVAQQTFHHLESCVAQLTKKLKITDGPQLRKNILDDEPIAKDEDDIL